MRVVLDTNVVFSALLFQHGALTWIRNAWQEERIKPLVCRESVEELIRVLAYPKFKLTKPEIEALLADYLPYTETALLPDEDPNQNEALLPVCPDPFDQVFLRLAYYLRAHALITGDRDLLMLKGKVAFHILAPDELMTMLDNSSAK